MLKNTLRAGQSFFIAFADVSGINIIAYFKPSTWSQRLTENLTSGYELPLAHHWDSSYPSAGCIHVVTTMYQGTEWPGHHAWCQTQFEQLNSLGKSRRWVSYWAQMGVSCILLTNWTGIYISFHSSCLHSKERQYYCSTVKGKSKEGERVLENPLKTVDRLFFCPLLQLYISVNDKYLPIISFWFTVPQRLVRKKKKNPGVFFVLKKVREGCLGFITNRTYPFDTVRAVKPLCPLWALTEIPCDWTSTAKHCWFCKITPASHER